ncbi:MAG: SDR family oxidoreductase [Gammaproteobacteria bacterium]|nr:SDR family oxidoreductase [Gammaproteobacteria bacterium]
MTKNIVITGANRGIGLALTKGYCARGDKVYAVCRQTANELSSLENTVVIEGIDITSDQDIQKMKQALYDIPLDIVINNAGILYDEVLGDINYQTIEKQYQVNALGPLRVSEALVDNLTAGSKIGLITSRMGSIADNTSGGRYGYRMSKAALNAAGMSLAQDLKSHQIAVAILHPGYVMTDMTNHTGLIDSALSASGLMQRIDELTIETTGSFWHTNGELLPW